MHGSDAEHVFEEQLIQQELYDINDMNLFKMVIGEHTCPYITKEQAQVEFYKRLQQCKQFHKLKRKTVPELYVISYNTKSIIKNIAARQLMLEKEIRSLFLD